MTTIDLNLSYVAPEAEDEMSNGFDDELVDVESTPDTSADLQAAIEDLEDLEAEESEEEAAAPAGPAPAPTPTPKPAGGVRRKWTILQKLRILKRRR